MTPHCYVCSCERINKCGNRDPKIDSVTWPDTVLGQNVKSTWSNFLNWNTVKILKVKVYLANLPPYVSIYEVCGLARCTVFARISTMILCGYVG